MHHTSFRLVATSLVTALAISACGGAEFGSEGSNVSPGGAGGDGSGSGGAPHAGGTTSAGGGSSSGGAKADGGSGGGGANVGGTAGTGTGARDSGVTTSEAGTGIVDANPGAGGSVSVTDAGTSSTDAGQVCPDPMTFYPDNDGDGFGRSTGTAQGCKPPSVGRWVTVGGDCDDDNIAVHPTQSDYFADAHSTSGGTHSFDYDCSNVEEGDPSQLGTAPNCGILSIVGCTGVGYAPTGRSGNGVNVLCGSKVQVTCKPSGIACTTVKSDVSVPYRCH